MAAEHQAAGGILVEPVRQRGRAWQPEAQRVEVILETQAALGAAMHRQAGRLVDHQHQPVTVEHAGEHFVRLRPIAHGGFIHHGQTAITAAAMDDSTNTTGKTWWQRLTGGMRRTSSSIGGAITDLVTKRKLDDATIEELEEVLIRADLGIDTAGRVAAAIAEGRYDKDASTETR